LRAKKAMIYSETPSIVYSEAPVAGIRIAPSILSSDFARLADEIAAVEKAGADLLHVDVMDGHFVPNLTIGPPIVEAIRKVTSLPLDVHLMITNPNDFIDEFARAGANYLTVHVEACPHLHRTVQAIKEKGMKAGVTLNPATPLVSIEPILPDADLLLIMSVNPGFGGQKFIHSVLNKIREARALIDRIGSRALLEVDGGVKVENAGEIAAAGADILVAGSAIFEVPGCDYGDVIARMRQTASSETASIRDTKAKSGKLSAASSRKRQ
jgi:ribulose-phosphate 3-epimerase